MLIIMTAEINKMPSKVHQLLAGTICDSYDAK